MSSKIDEPSQEVVITPNDCRAAYAFWEFFGIEPPEGLTRAVDNFTKTPTFENQQEFKFQLFHAVTSTDHPILKDDLFSKIMSHLAEETDVMQFDREIKNTLISD